MQLAVALYHNDVDDEDELEFRKGDVLTVLIENPNGLNGWWLCEKNGKCGLCPGNRLKLLANQSIDRARLSTASMYDDLSTDYDVPISAVGCSTFIEHDYDIPHRSDFISSINTNKPTDSSPESSSRSSGIYSSIDLRLSDLSSSSLSSDFHTSSQTKMFNNFHQLSSIDCEQLQSSFRKLSIHSSILDIYNQMVKTKLNQSQACIFIDACRNFLQEYGYLFDRQTYKIFKQTYLFELQQLKIDESQRFHQIAREIISIIRNMLEMRLKEKQRSFSTIPIDVFKKLNLEPIAEHSNENETKRLPNSMSTNQIFNKLQSHTTKNQQRPTQMTTSKTCYSSFLVEASKEKSDSYDYIDDDYSVNTNSFNDPLIKCYHRHIREHINSMLTRFSHSNQHNTISSLINEGKALIVCGQKLIFILETLHEQIQTPLIPLSKQLSQALASLLRLLKQLSHEPCMKTTQIIIQFQDETRFIINLAKRIKRHCNSI